MGLFLKLLDTLYGDTMAVLKSCEIDYDCRRSRQSLS